MTREQAKLMVPLLEAYGKGKTIQWKFNDEWVDVREMSAQWPAKEYRIKPEPREFWLCKDHHEGASLIYIHYSKPTSTLEEVIHVREVCE